MTVKWLSHPTSVSSYRWLSLRWRTNKKILFDSFVLNFFTRHCFHFRYVKQLKVDFYFAVIAHLQKNLMNPQKKCQGKWKRFLQAVPIGAVWHRIVLSPPTVEKMGLFFCNSKHPTVYCSFGAISQLNTIFWGLTYTYN